MKSTRAEVQSRVEAVFKLRLGGAEFADIREYAAAPEQSWNVSDTQLWRYIRAADNLVRERFDARADHLLNRHILQRRQLYAHAMGAWDFSTALRVLQDEAKLEGLYPPEKRELTGKDGGPLQTQTTLVLTDEQGAAGIIAIYARVGIAGPGPNRDGAHEPARPLLGRTGEDLARGGDDPRPLADGDTPLFG
jgi:hypothetical protein